MQRPPRNPKRHILGMRAVVSSLATGGAALAAVACIYLTSWLVGGLPAGQVSALTFSSIVAANLGLIAINRTGGLSRWKGRRPNHALRWVMGLASVTLVVSLYVPQATRLFRFESPGVLLLAAAVGLPVLVLAAMNLLLQNRPRGQSHGPFAPRHESAAR
jgi:Ca2+-transporting ATPase